MPWAARQALRDAHARLGGAACGAKQVAFLCSDHRTGGRQILHLNQEGRLQVPGQPLPVASAPMHVVAYHCNSILHHARVVGKPTHAACRDVEAVQRAGLEAGSPESIRLEVRIWRLEGLAWRQHGQQRREEGRGGGGRWERRGGCGRRGRRRREPGVVFELGAWGEERRALLHEEAAWALAPVMGGGLV